MVLWNSLRTTSSAPFRLEVTIAHMQKNFSFQPLKHRFVSHGLSYFFTNFYLNLDPLVPHAPKRVHGLNAEDQALAVKNALRYFDPKFHDVLREEFSQELEEYGHIYMYRFRPVDIPIKVSVPLLIRPLSGKLPQRTIEQRLIVFAVIILY